MASEPGRGFEDIALDGAAFLALLYLALRLAGQDSKVLLIAACLVIVGWLVLSIVAHVWAAIDWRG